MKEPREDQQYSTSRLTSATSLLTAASREVGLPLSWSWHGRHRAGVAGFIWSGEVGNLRTGRVGSQRSQLAT